METRTKPPRKKTKIDAEPPDTTASEAPDTASSSSFIFSFFFYCIDSNLQTSRENRERERGRETIDKDPQPVLKPFENPQQTI